MEIAIGMRLWFQDERDVECGTAIGFADDGDVVLDVMGDRDLRGPKLPF